MLFRQLFEPDSSTYTYLISCPDTGQTALIDPVLHGRTRTVKVRVNVPNPDGALKPDMFVRGRVRSRIAAGG